jgi:hypothetical protein
LGEALTTLEETTDWTCIPALVPVAFGKRADLAARAANAIQRLLAIAPVQQLLRLDKRVRQEQSEWPYEERFAPGWTKLNPETVSRRAAQMGSGLLAVCTFHPNGWVRSSAMTVLQEQFPSDALPFLLIRLGDWVPAIRAHALQLVGASVRPGNELGWCVGLPLLELVERSERAANPELKAQATALLQTEAGQAALQRSLAASDHAVRAFAFRRLLRTSGNLANETLSAGLLDADPRINRIAVDALSSSHLSSTALPAIRVGLRSPHPIARRYSLDAYARIAGREASEAVTRALEDKAAAVRGVARFYARQFKPEIDFAQFYRGLLGSCSPSIVAVGVEGLAELKAPGAGPLIKPYFWAKQVHLRAAALRAAVELGLDDILHWLWQALADSEPAISKLARDLLFSEGSSALPPNRVVRLATNARKSEAVRRNATALLRTLSKWQQPPPLLRVAHRAGGAVSEFAIELLIQWDANFNRLQSAPSEDEVVAFSKALKEAEAAIPAQLAKSLWFVIKPWGDRGTV